MIPSPDPAAAIGFFEVGYEPMDAIHREFRDLMVALVRGVRDQRDTLRELHEHLLRHCAQEEQWMRDTNFSSCACHQREHEMLLEVVAEVRRRVDAGDTEIAGRLAAELPQWFEVHANSMDAGLAFHLRGVVDGDASSRSAAVSPG